MKEGTMFFVLKFPSPWPPKEEKSLLSGPQNTSLFRIIAYPDGHLRFIIERENMEIVSHDTQPIKVTGTGYAIVSIVWTESSVSVHINGQELKPLEHAGSKLHIIETKEPVGEGILSFEHPEAKKRCGKWMEWRKNRYASPKPQAKEDRRLKSEAEQIKELQDAIASLNDSIGLVQAGNLHWLPNIATALRALVYWSDRRSQYNPLLLRMAGRMALPLPVFAFPESADNQPDILQEASYHYKRHEVMIQKIYPQQELMDIQEWLESTVQIERFKSVLSTSGTPDERTMRAKEIIVKSASTLGVAHYDDDVPLALDRLRHFKMMEVELLSYFLVPAAWVVVELGKFVLKTSREKGYAT